MFIVLWVEGLEFLLDIIHSFENAQCTVISSILNIYSAVALTKMTSPEQTTLYAYATISFEGHFLYSVPVS